MPTQNQKRNGLGIFAALLPFIIVFAIAYYNSVSSEVKPYQTWRDRVRHQQLSVAPRTQVPAGQVALRKDTKVVINKICLVFKGYSLGVVNMDLYLLELDPDIPYRLSYTKDSLREGVWIEDRQLQLVSVRKKVLYLKISNPH